MKKRVVVSGVKLEGNFLDRDDEFKSLVSIQPGEPYNADKVTETTKAFTEHFGNFGFAFARVEAVPEIDRETNRVAIVLRAEFSGKAVIEPSGPFWPVPAYWPQRDSSNVTGCLNASTPTLRSVEISTL